MSELPSNSPAPFVLQAPSQISLQAAVALAVAGENCSVQRLVHQLGVPPPDSQQLVAALIALGLAPMHPPADHESPENHQWPWLAVWADRPVARIPALLDRLNRHWLRHPQCRLGQLLVNLVGPSEPCQEIFYVEDGVLMELLDARSGASQGHHNPDAPGATGKQRQ